MEASSPEHGTPDAKTVGLARESVRAATAIDAALAGMQKDAASRFSALPQSLVADTAKTLSAFDTTKLVDVLGMKRVTETVMAMFPPHGVTPMIGALTGYQATPRLTEALGGIDVGPAFGFAKTLEASRPNAAEMHKLAKALGELDLPLPLTASIREALGRLPSTAVAGLASTAERTLSEAATLAKSTVVADVAEEAYEEVAGMTLTQRRDLQRDLLNAIALIVALVGMLVKSHHVQLASCLVAFLAVCLSVYWRLDDKTGEQANTGA